MNKTFRWTLDDYETKIGKKVSYSFEYSQYQITLTARLEKSDYKPFHIKATIDRDSENWKTRIKFKIINKENALETKKKKATFTNQEKKSKIIFDVPSSYFLHTSGYLNDGALEIDLTFEDEYSSDDDPFGSNIDPYDDIVYQSPNTTYSSNTTYWNTTYYKSQKNNSKEETGYVGLKNQGCTCYLNSFLQSMFHLPAFRRIVYSFHTTGNEDPETSIPLNLQRLFCQMQFSDEPCSTKSLTKSFGWGDSEAFEQHDIHEFCCVLLENIEKKLKGTELENSIAELFKGRFRSFIRCRNVNYESSRVEDFYDLQMTVKGCPNLEKSFESYVETEEFVGENQYKTDDYGLQDADMGTEFIEFPKILQLHLRRFDFDYNTLQQIKINDKFEFPKEIDLSPYLAKDSKGKPSVFELFGVLVHSGSAFAGHYYSFLRTKLDDQWYEFDDSDVTKTTEEKAINDNFGGEYQSITRNVWKREKSYSAYILIYVRKDAEHEVYTEIPNETVPKHLKDFFERSKEEKEHRKKLREEMKNQIPIELIDEDSIKVNTSKYENGFEVEDNKQIIYVEKTTKISELYNIISEKRQIPNENLILWKCKYSGVPTSVLPRNSTKIVSTFGYSLTLFIDNIPNFKQLEDDEINIWAKFFFPGKSYPLQYIGQFRIKSTSIISEIYEQINTKIGYPKDTSLISYIETTTYPKLINHSLTFDDESISTGSILIFQQTLGDELLTPNIEFYVNTKEDDHKNKEEEEIKDKGEYSNVPIINTNDNINPQMLSVKQFLSSRSELLEILVSDIHNLDTPLFFLRFPSSSTFTDVKCFIAKNANIDYSPENDSIELYKEDSEHPNKPSLNAMGLSYTSPNFLWSRNYLRNNYSYHHIYFNYIKGISEKELSLTRNIPILFSKDGYLPEKLFHYRVPKNDNINEIKNKLINEGLLDSKTNYRFIEEWNNKIYRIFSMNDVPYQTNSPLRIDVIPADQLNVNENELMIKCCYARKGDYYLDCFGFPFLIKLIPNENLSELKNRIKNNIKMSDEEFNKYDLIVGDTYGSQSDLIELKDDDIVIEKISKENDCLFLLSKEEKKKKKKVVNGYGYRTKEKALKIDN